MVRLFRKKIFEMAYSRQLYQGFVSNTLPQIAQNWCLCKYCQLYRPDLNDTYIYWRSELETHLNNLNQKETNPTKNKERWTRQSIIDQDKYNLVLNVLKKCRLKFLQENEGSKNKPGLGITEDQQKEVCTLFADSLEDIISCISGPENVENYTRSIFPDLV